MNDPQLIINGMVSGNKCQAYYGHVEVLDQVSNMMADIHYNPWDDNSYKQMIGKALNFKKFGIGKKKEEEAKDQRPKRADDIIIQISQNSNTTDKKLAKKQEKVVLSKGEGSWLSHLVLDNEVVWKIEDDVPLWSPVSEVFSDGTKMLPSDMERRTDIPPMLIKDWDAAEKEKTEMEQQQRDDEKRRDAAAKKRKGK